MDTLGVYHSKRLMIFVVILFCLFWQQGIGSLQTPENADFFMAFSALRLPIIVASVFSPYCIYADSRKLINIKQALVIDSIGF
jgi:hypothetical protein